MFSGGFKLARACLSGLQHIQKLCLEKNCPFGDKAVKFLLRELPNFDKIKEIRFKDGAVQEFALREESFNFFKQRVIRDAISGGYTTFSKFTFDVYGCEEKIKKQFMRKFVLEPMEEHLNACQDSTNKDHENFFNESSGKVTLSFSFHGVTDEQLCQFLGENMSSTTSANDQPSNDLNNQALEPGASPAPVNRGPRRSNRLRGSTADYKGLP